MFASKITELKKLVQENPLYVFLLFFCILLPFQFALNPADGFDLAIVRVLIPIAFLFYIFFAFKNKDLSLSNEQLTYLFLIFIFLNIFSITFSSNFSWSLRKLLFPLTTIPIYFISVYAARTLQKKRMVVVCLVAGATTISWMAIMQFLSQFVFGITAVYAFLAHTISPIFLGNSFSDAVIAYPSWLVNAGGVTYMRAFALFPDPHMLSYYLGMLIPWSIALWALAKKQKVWLFISMLSLIIADALTFTRGGYIALIAAAIIVIPVVSRKTAVKLVLGALFFIFLFMIAPRNPVVERLSSSFDMQEGSNQARLSNWQQAINIISAHPFGVGIGSYSLAVKPTADYREPIYAHNAYLDIAAELGVPAATVFILLLLTALRSFWRQSKENPFFIAGIASITVFSIHSLVENPLYSVHVFPLFLIILTLSISNSKKHAKNSNSN